MTELVTYLEQLKENWNVKIDIQKSMELQSVQEYFEESLDLYLQYYEKKDLDAISDLLNEQRKMRKELTKEIHRCEYQAIILSCEFVQTYNIFNKLLQYQAEEHDIEENVRAIRKTHRHVDEVLKYLYKHMHVQHKVLCEELGIAASTLSDLTDLLEDASCIQKLKCGRTTFYNLTNEGRKYVKKHMPEIDVEIIVDQRQYQNEVRIRVHNKEKYVEAFQKCRDRNENRFTEKWVSERNEKFCLV